MFRVVRSTSRFLYLTSPQDEGHSFKPKQNKVNFFPGVLRSCKSILKRKLFGEREDDDHSFDTNASSVKKPKINPSPEEAIELALINPQECVLLIHHHAYRILELKEEFLQQKKISKIIDGVSKSRILKLGNVHTVFTLLEPKSYTDYSSCNFDLNFILCDGESIVLKTMTRTEDEQFHEVRHLITGFKSRIKETSLTLTLKCNTSMLVFLHKERSLHRKRAIQAADGELLLVGE